MNSLGSLAKLALPPDDVIEMTTLPITHAAPSLLLWLVDELPANEQSPSIEQATYATPAMAWDVIDKTDTDCLLILNLTDWQANLDFCRTLRSHRHKYDSPAIMIATDNEAALAAIRTGASDFCLAANVTTELSARIYQCWLNYVQARRIALQLDEQREEIVQTHMLTEKIVDSLPVSLHVVDKNLRIVAWNRNREIGGQGIDRRQVIGRDVLQVFSKMPQQKLEHEFQQVFDSGETLRFEQESKADGNQRYWYISKCPIWLDNENREVTHVMTIGEEITEQKTMNAAVIHAEKLAGIGRLASGIVHEINNPLATIAACTEALQMRLEETATMMPESQSDFAEYLKLIHDETFRCKTITNNLLDFARHRESEKSELDINYLVEQTLRLVKHHPKLKRLQLDISLTADLPVVSANEAQIKQVFIALITNACDVVDEVTGELGIITGLQTSKGQQFISIEFSDNGTGIPPEMLTKIFEPFVTTKPFGQGTGLGLAVCYGIVSDHGGKIEVSSEVGKGTIMKVLLPVAQDN